MQEMNSVKKKLLAKIRYVAVVIPVMSLYFSGLFNTAIKTLDTSKALNPIWHIRIALQFGWPIGWFFFCIFLFGMAFGYFFVRELKASEGMDKMGRLFKQTQKRQSYGDSHFEEPEEYRTWASIQSVDKAYGTILGQIGDDGKRLLNVRMDNTRSNRNIAVVGASGSGKTFTFAKPFCYQVVKRRESIVITDPDGGLYRDMAGYFQDHGYVVRRLDLTNLNKSDGWDCMRSIKPWNADLDAQMFAQTVIANTVDDLTSIYATGPMSLLKALILRVYLGHDFPEEMKNIGTVYSLLQNPQGESFLDAMFDSSQLTEEEMPCLGPYLSFKQGSPNLRGNLITNLSVQLQLLQNKLVCKVLSTDDIDLLLPGQQPCAYFCLFPDSHDTFRFIVSLFFSMFFTNLISYADQKCGGALPIPVNFLLDEFPSIGHLPDWDRKMATIRKRNLAAVMIFQNITQLQNLYDTTWTTILSNCATMVSLGINDGDTAEMWSKRIGDTTIQAQTEQHPAQEALFAFAHSHSEGEGRRALLSYDELHKIDQDDCIILFQGHNPIWARKYPHTLHPESHKLRTIYPDEIPDITDFTARKARREQENERVADYLKKHPLPSPEDRKYKGLCEPDPEESIRSSVWNKAREELFRFRTGLDKRDEDGKHDAVSKGNLKDGTAVSVREIETITFADEEKENDLNDIVFKKAMVPATDMVLEEGNVDNDVREDTVPKEPDSGQGTQNDAHEKAAAAKAPPVNVAELFSSVSADLPSQQQENRQNGEKEVLAAMRGRRQSGRTIRFSSTVNRPKGGQQDRTPPVMEGSVPPGKRKDEMK